MKLFNINSFVFIISALLVSIILHSCKEETIDAVPTSYNYFPADNGRWVEYTVDSIYHSENDNNNDDSVYSYHFEIREVIDSSFIDGSGLENQVIKRYRRTDSLSAWTITDVWTQKLTPTSAYRTEDNVAFHKLSFPINSTITWNGNDANTYEEEIYYYDFFHQSHSVNSLSFDSALSVIQIDENNFIEKIYGQEIYAAGVGLIFKQRDDLGKFNGIIVKGLEYKMMVKSFGKL
jgi:hypothetical protein